MEFIQPKNDKRMISICYYKYDDSLFQALCGIIGEDKHLNNYEAIKDKNIEEYSFIECKTFANWLVRGKRFCDGLIAGAIKDNSILKLLNRSLELC